MKKTGILLAVLLMSTIISAQEKKFPVTKSGEIEISDTIATSLAKDKMYSAFNVWLAGEITNYKEAVQFDDAGEGRVVANIRIPAGRTSFNKKRVETDLSFTLSVDFRDNKYRFVIKNVMTHGRVFGGGGIAPRFYNDTPDRHFRHIEQYQEKIALLEAKNSPTAEELSDIEVYKQEIERENSLYNTEYEELLKFIESMKAAIISDDDF